MGSENRMYKSLRKGSNHNSRAQLHKQNILAPLNETDAEESKTVSNLQESTKGGDPERMIDQFMTITNRQSNTTLAPLLTPVKLMNESRIRQGVPNEDLLSVKTVSQQTSQQRMGSSERNTLHTLDSAEARSRSEMAMLINESDIKSTHLPKIVSDLSNMKKDRKFR